MSARELGGWPVTDAERAAQDAACLADCQAACIDHSTCAPEAHDRSLPDDGGRPYGQPRPAAGPAA
jgi:hypothetical protein